ncbi:MAG: hypothetical protein RR744_10745, partial [Cellulosilyticaceae bacterium]
MRRWCAILISFLILIQTVKAKTIDFGIGIPKEVESYQIELKFPESVELEELEENLSEVEKHFFYNPPYKPRLEPVTSTLVIKGVICLIGLVGLSASNAYIYSLKDDIDANFNQWADTKWDEI